MLIAILSAILGAGALAALLAIPRRKFFRAIASLAPLAALVVVFLPLPLDSEVSLRWLPQALFPEPMLFRTDPASRTFAILLLILLNAIEWTGLARRRSRRMARASAFLLAVTALAAYSGANALALVLSWAWMDLIAFGTLVLASPRLREGPVPEELRHEAISGRAVSSFSFSLLSSFLLLISFLPAIASRGSGLEAFQGPDLSNLAALAFLAAIVLRLGILPWQTTLSPLRSQVTGTDVLLRLVPPSAALALAARAWPPQLSSPPASYALTWVALGSALAVFLAGVGWWVAAEPLVGRTAFILGGLALAGLTAAQGLAAPAFFEAAGAIVLLGGGMLLLYRGQGSWQRWSSAWAVGLAVVFAGMPLTSGSTLGSPLYSALISGRSWAILLAAGFGQMLLVAALLRTAFTPGEDLPAGERAVWFAYYGGLSLCLGGLVIPTLPKTIALLRANPASALIPFGLVLVGGSFLARMARKLREPGEEAFHFIERVVGLDWLWKAVTRAAVAILRAIGAVNEAISGEGAMLWALGLSILVWILLQGR